ncbi:MAG: hypothetical protein ABEJ69_00880 [Candidatus Nanohaloarchaea archaeon]
MNVSINAMVVLILVILAVVGVYMAVSSVYNNVGDNITESGEGAGSKLGCVFQNPADADSECKNTAFSFQHHETLQEI